MNFFNTASSFEQKISHPIFDEKMVEVWIKRDDLLHPFVSGNKYRKLKYLVQDAMVQGKTQLVTFGGAYSNHLVATASAGAALGIKTTAILRGDERLNNPMLTICQLYGMEILQVSREDYRDKDACFDRFFKGDKTVYRIEEGGYSAIGAKGCADLVSELTNEYSDIFCSVGTGTTLAGLINGTPENTNVHGVVVLKGAEYLEAEVNQLLTHPKSFTLHHTFHGGGYGKFDKETIDFIKEFATKTGILLDPVYTAKMMKGLFTLIEQDYFAPGSKILAVHTGGLWGLTSERVSGFQV